MNKYQKELNAYLEKIEEVKRNAINDGYEIEDNIIKDSKKELLVMESYFYGETQYESYGQFRIIRKFIVLEESIKDELIKIRDSKENKQEFCNFWEEHCADDPIAYGIEVVDFGYGEIREEDVKWISEESDLLHKENALLEIALDCDYGKWNGYMSFFMINSERYKRLLERQEQLDVFLKKHIKY